MKLALPLIAILLLAGCSQERDVAYYKDHPADRGKRVSDCDTYRDGSQDCINAREAQLAIYAAQVREPAKESSVAAVK
jgi:hypothetical protein